MVAGRRWSDFKIFKEDLKKLLLKGRKYQFASKLVTICLEKVEISQFKSNRSLKSQKQPFEY